MNSENTTVSTRYKFAAKVIRAAGRLAMSYSDNLGQLKVEKKVIKNLFLRQKGMNMLFWKKLLIFTES